MHEHHDLKEIHHQGVLRVRVCGCGVVHLGIGPVTVQVTAEAFDQVLAGLEEAKRVLGRGSRRPAPPPLIDWLPKATH